jgi:hypothetical protein
LAREIINMKLTIECQANFLVELYRAVRAACNSNFLILNFQDDIMTIQEEGRSSSLKSWVEIEISSQTFFKTYSVKSKHSKNRVILKCVSNDFLEGIQASSSLAGTKVLINLATAEDQVYLNFSCEVPEEDDTFFYEKQVFVMIQRSNESVVPDIPNSIECELHKSQRLHQFLLTGISPDSLLHLCLSIDDCHSCKAKDVRDLDFIFKCSHNRKNFILPSSCKLTTMFSESSKFSLIACFFNLTLQEGQCSLYNLKTVVKNKDFSTVLQKTTGLNWDKILFGIQHESEVIISASWKVSLFVRFVIPAQIDE